MQSVFEKTDLELDKLGSQIAPRLGLTRELISEYEKLYLDAGLERAKQMSDKEILNNSGAGNLG